jgi:glycosyltransferase involved in cell wall biosynthesis
VITAAIDGLGEPLEDGRTGLLVAPGASEPLTHAIVELASKPARAMGEDDRDRAPSRFLVERRIDRTRAFLPSLVRRIAAGRSSRTPALPVSTVSSAAAASGKGRNFDRG